jgi:8-oxo-dGTP pyrophosphatase MutT (NUDIX family)
MRDWENLASGVEDVLRGALPGLAAQLTMVPEPRPGHRTYEDAEASSLKAAILLFVFPRAGDLVLLLTRRTDRVLRHRGQISFPGGEQHPGEPPLETALRETEEETGADLSRARILGALTPLYIPPSNYCVYPFVAFTGEAPQFRPQPDEVAEVLEVPLDHLREAGNTRAEVWTLNGSPVRVPYFEFRGHKIWGATAMVLAEFLAVLGQAQERGKASGVGRKS